MHRFVQQVVQAASLGQQYSPASLQTKHNGLLTMQALANGLRQQLSTITSRVHTLLPVLQQQPALHGTESVLLQLHQRLQASHAAETFLFCHLTVQSPVHAAGQSCRYLFYHWCIVAWHSCLSQQPQPHASQIESLLHALHSRCSASVNGRIVPDIHHSHAVLTWTSAHRASCSTATC